MKLFEWNSCSFKEYEDILPGFAEYLSVVWRNRVRYTDNADDISEEEVQERKIQHQRFFDFTIDGKISARNYVGVVQYENLRIEVCPKIFRGCDAEKKGHWKLNLLYWLSYCRKIRFPWSYSALSKLPFDDFLELLIYVFAHHALETLSQQPFQAYHGVEEETVFLRGSLLFDKYSRQNLATGRQQFFYCSHQPFVYDNLFNRIVKHVVLRLLALSQHPVNRDKLGEILFLLHDVSDLRCTAGDCDKVRLNPLYEDHQQVLALCKLYLSDEILHWDPDNSRNFCFLIPMEYVFEDFVFGFIDKKWPLLCAGSQSSAVLARNGSQAAFSVRNDIYLRDRLIIDTKYKIRDPVKNVKAGVNHGDLYQMVSYSIARGCSNVLLLYPATEGGFNEGGQLKVESKMLTGPVSIDARSLDIRFEDIRAAEALLQARIEEVHKVFRP